MTLSGLINRLTRDPRRERDLGSTTNPTTPHLCAAKMGEKGWVHGGAEALESFRESFHRLCE